MEDQSSSVMADGQGTPSQIIIKNNEGVVSDSVLPLRRMIVFGADGVPRPVSVPLLTKQSVEDLAVAALSLPYKIPPAPPPLDPLSLELPTAEYKERLREHNEGLEFIGMSNAEVMIVKLARAAAAGSMQATETLLDRVLGRPKQSLESKSMTMTYADVLKEKAARAEAVDVLAEVARRTEDNSFPPAPELEDPLKDLM